MSIHVRPFRVEHYPRLVEINNLVFQDDHWTVEEARQQDAPWDDGPFERTRLVAEDASGAVVGFGRINRRTQGFRFREYEMNIIVDPSCQRLGIGSAILERLLDELRVRHAPMVSSHARESVTAGKAFLKKHRFTEVRRSVEWSLDLSAFDSGRFSGVREQLAAGGITLTSLAAERRHNSNAMRKVFDLHSACVGNVQAVSLPVDTVFQHFLDRIVEGVEALPDGFAMAKVDNRYVGESILRRSSGHPSVVRIWFTGVLDDYRRRGIGTALTLANIEFAREHGYGHIRSGSSARNQPIRKLYENLGFRKDDSWLVFERRLEAG